MSGGEGAVLLRLIDNAIQTQRAHRIDYIQRGYTYLAAEAAERIKALEVERSACVARVKRSRPRRFRWKGLRRGGH